MYGGDGQNWDYSLWNFVDDRLCHVVESVVWVKRKKNVVDRCIYGSGSLSWGRIIYSFSNFFCCSFIGNVTSVLNFGKIISNF